MDSLSRLIDRDEPVAPASPCAALHERFLQHGETALVAVVELGRVVGQVERSALLARFSAGLRPELVGEVMEPALLVDASAGIADAREALLADPRPLSGAVACEDGVYVGVVTAKTLLRAGQDNSLDGQRHAARALADAQAQALAAQVGKTRFLEIMSHEIRTPMNGLVAVADLLRRQPLTPDGEAYVRTIIESSETMLRLLGDALDLARADEGPLELKPAPTSLRALMDDVQSVWHARASQDGVRLLVSYDGEAELTVSIDAGRLRQIFDTLIGEALKLARRGAVEASLRARAAPEGVFIEGRVRDTGRELSPAQLARIFEPLNAVDEDGIVTTGSGLGPALCRRIMDAMNGAIRAESNAGAGATISFDLLAPLAEAIPAPGAAQQQQPSASRSAHVLVVDDNATNRMVAEALCEMFDCTSESAEDGFEAVEAARTGRFDLILMDIKMPRMDGVEATRAIRALGGHAARVPIIALTANADPDDAKAYVACGMTAVVEKPIKADRLLQAINDALAAGDGEPERTVAAA